MKRCVAFTIYYGIPIGLLLGFLGWSAWSWYYYFALPSDIAEVSRLSRFVRGMAFGGTLLSTLAVVTLFGFLFISGITSAGAWAKSVLYPGAGEDESEEQP